VILLTAGVPQLVACFDASDSVSKPGELPPGTGDQPPGTFFREIDHRDETEGRRQSTVSLLEPTVEPNSKNRDVIAGPSQSFGFLQNPRIITEVGSGEDNNSLDKLAHKELAGRGHFVRVSHSFDAGPRGLYC
jgi:hypothetical protein